MSVMKYIRLNRGQRTLVDDEDFERFNKFKWYTDPRGFVVSGQFINGNRTTIRLHRLIMSTPRGLETDHINHNRLDNRKSNLRICTTAQNKANSKMYRTNTTGYKGVSRHSSKDPQWRARIGCQGKIIHLGLFPSPVLAAKRYDQEALKLFGEYANLNFKAIV